MENAQASGVTRSPCASTLLEPRSVAGERGLVLGLSKPIRQIGRFAEALEGGAVSAQVQTKPPAWRTAWRKGSHGRRTFDL